MPQASREFQVMVKPIGSICNLDCTYCYYLEKRDLYPHATTFRMNEEVLEHYIIQHIEAAPKETILFSWHGGEPTALGIDYFRKIVALQKKHAPPGREILNGIQTNGTLLDEEWGQFLAKEKFYVGLSLDGPRELHDAFRIDKVERSTHRRVVQAYRLLRRHGVTTDLLCVVHSKNVRHPLAVYRFFKELGIESLQFLPLVARGADGKTTVETVPAQAYGEFLNAIFDEWVRRDAGRLVIQNFEEATRPYLGVEHALCIFRKTCGDVPVVEFNGDFYSCDHFVVPKHRLGNIRERTLAEMLDSEPQREFGQKKAELPRYCRECEFLESCNGGCPKDRFIQTPDGEAGLNYLCAGYKTFFGHTQPYLRQLAALQLAGKPVEALRQQVLAAEARASPKAGRNDPCPCGSGKRYKACCLGRAAQR